MSTARRTGAPKGPWLRAFRAPRRWLALGAAGVIAVIAVSLLPAGDLPPSPFANSDKVGHFLTYALLSAYACMLFARMRPQALSAAALIVLGVGLEYAQALLTDSRMGDSRDAFANALGVLAGLMTAPTRLALMLQRIDGRLADTHSS
ncbi:VanZ family protein [Lysobacter sp. 5GHs7-4]|uniref:VanZ family protein n=1 Tax=Lysobacter sp. 5GHs7-4 TaxID=2904253 RepID=UPI001E64ADD6|nr:VanZ family protein [Lysobacter sp. 5GHs7-4]UHQ23728.1 VanZ family protein [Lysobacter sp. 5GHs7-4]